MELNLYGVASIQLDKIKGGRIKKILLKAIICKSLWLTPYSICCNCHAVLFFTKGGERNDTKLRRIRKSNCRILLACD